MDANEDQRVAEWYNTLSPSYDELYSAEQSPKHDAVIEFIGSEKLEILVEVGCGPGKFLQAARQLYRYGVGIDLSIDMLRAAKKNVPGNTDLILATSRALPVRDEAANGLVSISTLRMDSSLPHTITELRRICCRKGLLAISLFHDRNSEAAALLSASELSESISDRETLYLFRSKC